MGCFSSQRKTQRHNTFNNKLQASARQVLSYSNQTRPLIPRQMLYACQSGLLLARSGPCMSTGLLSQLYLMALLSGLSTLSPHGSSLSSLDLGPLVLLSLLPSHTLNQTNQRWWKKFFYLTLRQETLDPVFV